MYSLKPSANDFRPSTISGVVKPIEMALKFVVIFVSNRDSLPIRYLLPIRLVAQESDSFKVEDGGESYSPWRSIAWPSSSACGIIWRNKSSSFTMPLRHFSLKPTIAFPVARSTGMKLFLNIS